MSNFKRLTAIALVLCVFVGVFAACSFSPAGKLIGTWRDSTGTTGYEFKEDNLCVITLANTGISFVDQFTNVDGAYTVEKRDDGNYYVVIKYTLYAKTITSEYMFTVKGDTLTLTDPSDGSSRTLMAYKLEGTDNTVSQTNAATVS